MDRVEDKITCFVFRTNLQTPEDVEDISMTLNGMQGIIDWSVDLEDWENVLRVEGAGINPERIISKLRLLGVKIQEMPV